MAAWVPAAITAATTLLGHAMGSNSRQGSPNQIDTGFIMDQINQVNENTERFKKNAMSTANAGTGFSRINNERSSAMMGTPGAAGMMNEIGTQNIRSALDAGLAADQAGQASVNQLVGMKTQAEAQNVSMANDFQQSEWMQRLQQGANLTQGLLAGSMGAWGEYRDQQRAQQFQSNFQSLMERMEQNRNQSNWNNMHQGSNSMFMNWRG